MQNFSENKDRWENDQNSHHAVEKLAQKIRKNKTSDEFDCIIGISGGLDSSYAAYIAVKKMGLKPLLFHSDAGWNTSQAVKNIEKLIDGLGIVLYTEVANWEAVKRMQVAFLRSGIPDQDLVQDAVFFSDLYKFAKKYKIKHVITGSNYSTESCREPEAWGGYAGIDKTLFLDIWKKYGDDKPIDDFPLIDIFGIQDMVSKISWYESTSPFKSCPIHKERC